MPRGEGSPSLSWGFTVKWTTAHMPLFLSVGAEEKGWPPLRPGSSVAHLWGAVCVDTSVCKNHFHPPSFVPRNSHG